MTSRSPWEMPAEDTGPEGLAGGELGWPVKGPRREQGDPLSLWNSSPAHWASPTDHGHRCPERQHGNTQGQLFQET